MSQSVVHVSHASLSKRAAADEEVGYFVVLTFIHCQILGASSPWCSATTKCRAQRSIWKYQNWFMFQILTVTATGADVEVSREVS